MTQHYQDNLGGWHVLDSVEHEHLLAKNNPTKTFTAKTQAEYDAAHVPLPPTVEERKAVIQAQIDNLEREQLLPRIARDVFLIQMEKEAIALGAAQVPALDAATSLAIAYATNIGYKKLKDFDAAITALRTQMDAII